MQRHDNHERDRNDRAICDLLYIMVCQNEAILALLEDRKTKLSPKDRAMIDEIFEIESGDIRKIDATLAK